MGFTDHCDVFASFHEDGFNRIIGIDMNLRAMTYDGSAPALDAIVGGQADIMFASLFSAQPWIDTGRLRALAVAGGHRIPQLPTVPTLREAGLDTVDITQWYALFAPARTPRPVAEELTAALKLVLGDPRSVRQIAEHHGLVVEAVQQVGELDRRLIRKRALERFSPTRMAEEYEAVYRRVIAERERVPTPA